jgi:hypothetical protein
MKALVTLFAALIVSLGANAATISVECTLGTVTEGKISKVSFHPSGRNVLTQRGLLTFHLKNVQYDVILETLTAAEGLQLAALLNADDTDRLHLVMPKNQGEFLPRVCASIEYTLEFNK